MDSRVSTTERPSPYHLLIRADASEEMGNGHVMRMIALAQAWQKRGGSATFLSCHCPESLTGRLRIENIQFKKLNARKPGSPEDADATIGHAIDANSAAIVLDGYSFDEQFQARVNQQFRPLLVVDDDCHCRSYHCNLILNQNLGASSEMYSYLCPDAEVLAGPKYALLRNEFLDHNEFERDSTSVRHLLVTLGGSKVANIVSKIANSLQLIKNLDLETRVLVGGSNRDLLEIQAIIQNCPGISILPSVADMSKQYRWADTAIVGGGSSNWEMCLFGLPRCIVVLADNQRQVAAQLSAYGSAINLGDASKLTNESIATAISELAKDTELRTRLSSRSKDLVDGLGAMRVVDDLMSAILRCGNLTFACGGLEIRSATMADSDLLLGWRNDASTRLASRNDDEVTPQQHQQWLRETLNGENRRLLIAESNKTPVGTVRLDFADEVEISWTIAPAARGQGWGKKMVACVARLANCDMLAYVRKENIASRKIAVAAGFDPAGKKDDLLIYRRPSCQ